MMIALVPNSATSPKAAVNSRIKTRIYMGKYPGLRLLLLPLLLVLYCCRTVGKIKNDV